MSCDRENMQESKPVNVTSEAGGMPSGSDSTIQDSQKMWYVAYVGTCAEKAVRDRLRKEGYDAFAATQWELRVRSSGRRVRIERPIITQYVFVRVSEEERKIIVKYPYIHYFLTDKATEKNEFGRHRFAIIPDNQMKTLQSMLSQDEDIIQFTSTGFSIGDEVAILGWGDEVTGNIVRIHGEKGRFVGVRINQLGCAYMEVSPSKLVKATKK
jgi:transcription antitermination factor NusG